jgi:hypothetical protein
VSPSKSVPPARSRKSVISLKRLWYVATHPHPFLLGTSRWYIANSLSLLLASRQGTKDVRLDPQLNKKVWESGIKGVPFRVRVRISRKRNDEEGAKEKLYSYVQAVNVKDPKGMSTAVVEDT